MKLRDLEHPEIPVCLISHDAALREGLTSAAESYRPAGQIKLRVLADLADPAKIQAIVILADLPQISATGTELAAWLDSMRRSNPSVLCIALFSAKGGGVSANPIRDSGFDLALARDDVSLIVANIFGVSRYVRSIGEGRRIHHDRAALPSDRIGGWVLIPRLRSVKLPDQTERKLTEAEWTYLQYLVGRDVNRIEIREDLRAKMDGQPRRNAIVYKLKKKLGDDFPIISVGPGQYGIDLSRFHEG